MRRKYKEAVAVERGGAWIVTLDDRPLQTPGGQDLTFPDWRLAEAVAAEWEAQETEIRPATMPLMQLVATAVDKVAATRGQCLDELARYAGTDLLCYRADEPPALVARQQALWQPLLDWAAAKVGAELTVVSGLMPADQPPEAIARLRAAAERLDDLALAAVMAATAAAGSVVIGLALHGKRLSAEEAYAASQLDETFQIEQWGEDSEATQRRAALKAEMLAIGRLLDLIS